MTISGNPSPDVATGVEGRGKPDFVKHSMVIPLSRGRDVIIERFRPILHREGFTEAQWRVLRILFDVDQLTSVEIADQACIHKVSISRITSTLEQDGLVVRTASDRDGRASFIALSPAGRARMAPLVAEALVIRRKVTEDFGQERYEQLMHLLAELAKLND